MRRADSFPSHELDGIHYRIGRIFPFGASIVPHGVNFSIFSKDAYSCELLLYHTGHEKPFIRIPFPEEFRIGDVYAMTVFDLDIEDIEYGFSFDGPYDPKRGLLFNKNNILLDPYAKSITGRTIWGQVDKGHEEFVHRGRIIYEDFDWRGDIPLDTPLSDLIIYEMHVKDFTRGDREAVSGANYAGVRDKIGYLTRLGVNCVELMPIQEWTGSEYRWGYNPACYFAPENSLSSHDGDGTARREVKEMIDALHRAGIAVVLDVVYNHTYWEAPAWRIDPAAYYDTSAPI
ncbi:MAG: glycogen debranching enzyme, partial [Erysipelotrichia bacterium]|nr:glycogen debranching enzyme [Erysipelotrichia bacterium]